MIRALLTLSGAAVVAALVAAPLVGQGILAAPGGEAILVATDRNLHKASFDGGCSPATVAELAPGRADAAQVVAFTLTGAGGNVSVLVREVPAGDSLAGATLVVLLDETGGVLFAGNADALDEAHASSCGERLQVGSI